MPGADRKNRPDLIGHLLAAPDAFDFVQALQLLRISAEADAEQQAANAGTAKDTAEQVPAAPGGAGQPKSAKAKNGAVPHAPPYGEAFSARLIANPSLGYPETELAKAAENAQADFGGPGNPTPTLAMNFLGLHGPSGVLPSYVTQSAMTAGRDYALVQVLDYFNNHFANAFARASELAHVALQVARPQAPTAPDRAGIDRVAKLLVTLAGVRHGAGGDVGARSRQEEFAIGGYFSAAWRQRPMPLTSLQSMLRDILGVPVRILPFEPLWIGVNAESRMCVGVARTARGPASHRWWELENQTAGEISRRRDRAAAGKSAWVLGRRTRQTQGGIRVRIGPLDMRTYCRLLLPRARLLSRLSTLIGAAIGPWADFVIQPVLAKEEVHPCILIKCNLQAIRGVAFGSSSKAASPGGAPPAKKAAIPPAVLGRTMFLLKKPKKETDNLYPYDADFDQLKITSSAMRRTSRSSRRRSTPRRSAE
ncbi:MAG TPA: type VI secretion system baseplate subunit TssG [Tepidisphaeraceae bacterium]|jgi:type VI secretion system protein ImpH|nr:type VI secretion system baseplate subunit TssG [Tepidisphaeraceae bacterium]